MTATTTFTLRDPADVVGAIPWFLGFHPEESLVLICLAGLPPRMRLCARSDVADLDHPEAVASLVRYVQRAQADTVVLVCYPRDEQVASAAGTNRLAEEARVRATTDALVAVGVDVRLSLAVVDGRWYSYDTTGRAGDTTGSASPAEGTPVDTVASGVTAALAAAAVGSGRTVVRSRSELVAMVAAPEGLRAQVLGSLAEQVSEDVARQVRIEGAATTRAQILARFDEVWARWRTGDQTLNDTESMQLVVGVQDVHTRDAIIGTDPGADGVALCALLSHLARCTDEATAAPVCSALACTAMMEGDGALANVALDRALQAEPRYSLAGLLLEAVTNAVPPPELREVWRARH